MTLTFTDTINWSVLPLDPCCQRLQRNMVLLLPALEALLISRSVLGAARAAACTPGAMPVGFSAWFAVSSDLSCYLFTSSMQSAKIQDNMQVQFWFKKS